MSLVRMRVASSDWWASRQVVSVSSRPLWARTAAAKALGPSFFRMSRRPCSGSVTSTTGTTGSVLAGREPLTPSSEGWPLTARLAR